MKFEVIAHQSGVLYVRRILIVVGLAGIILFSSAGTGGIPLLATAIFSAFLGITNFGRQCPLLAFLRQIVQRLRV